MYTKRGNIYKNKRRLSVFIFLPFHGKGGMAEINNHTCKIPHFLQEIIQIWSSTEEVKLTETIVLSIISLVLCFKYIYNNDKISFLRVLQHSSNVFSLDSVVLYSDYLFQIPQCFVQFAHVFLFTSIHLLDISVYNLNTF